MTGKQLTVKGVTLNYRLDGCGPEPLICVHGVGASMDSWNDVVQQLKERFNVLTFDLRGHGQSSKVKGRYEIQDFTNETLALADHVGFKSFNLLGFSLGGLIAQNIALTVPERVRKLFLLSTVAGRNEDEKARVLARLDALQSGERGAHFDASVSRWFSDDFRLKNPDLIEKLRLHNAQNDPDCYASSYRVLAETDFADRLADIACPTLIATGEFDIGSNTRMAQFMHETINGSQLAILPKMRHSVLVEASQQIATLAENFFLTGKKEHE